MGITSIDAAPAKVVGEPRGLGEFYQPFEALEMCPVKLIGRAEVNRYPVLDDTVLFEDLIENFQRPASLDHEILRDDLEPVDDGFAREDVVVVRNSQADSDTVILKSIEAITRHRYPFCVRSRAKIGRAHV